MKTGVSGAHRAEPISPRVSNRYGYGSAIERLVLSSPKLIAAGQNQTSTADEREILTLRQVAESLKVTERTIYRLAAGKKVPAFKVGGTRRFSKAEIPEWIQQQSQGVKPIRRNHTRD